MGLAYGETMGEYFSPGHQPLVVQSAALANHVAFTYIRCDGEGTGMTQPIPDEPALLLAVQLGPLRRHDLWLDGRAVKVTPYAPGAFTMLDLRTRPVANLASSYECLQMYFPRSALDYISDSESVARFGDLPTLNGADDAILAHLAQVARMTISPAGPATSLLLESLMLSVHRHISTNYAHQRTPYSRIKGGLAAWQEQRAKEYMEAYLGSNINLMDLAAQCQLSPSQFGRAFKVTTGTTPHRWLVERRLARARGLLAHTDNTLADIAQECGFSDQSHLAREFRRAEGTGLMAWRRLQSAELRGGPVA